MSFLERGRELIAGGVPEKACFLGCSAMLLKQVVEVVDLHCPFAASNVGALSRGPRELRERVGRAEAQVASMLRATFIAILLPNAKSVLLLI